MEQQNERYARHYSLKGFGIPGQQKLAAARVLVVGAGGLGCPVLQYLAAAGVGTIGIADPDMVSLSNLQRQVLYTTDDVGKRKAEVAVARLKAINPEIIITAIPEAISTPNALELIAQYDIVSDCTDNFTSRYLINDACVLLCKPLVFGAIFQYEGQVAVFNVKKDNGTTVNYRHLFPTPPSPLKVQDCNEAGVLGVLPGIIGTLQATEIIKYITGIGQVMAGRLYTYNLLTAKSFCFQISENADVNSLIPVSKAAFKATDYDWVCGTKVDNVEELTANEFISVIDDADTIIIDVRERHELPEPGFRCVSMPMSGIVTALPDIREKKIVLFCQSGKRSLKAAQLFIDKYKSLKNISHLRGGILALEKQNE
ncbi:molybdopterin-synthase adenylyltransferase MoeB [Flavobacterium rhizosphaerae]|uniref:HesA/MoeB/ThiF family protein n=1 Tax=Flavobacterium rhizosphaerae TaxID=3163298 RepID=A0ABW8YY23_9FLAO